jgi:arylsulfatase A-like enzyme
MSTAEYFTQKGSDFINQAHENDQPFFLYLPYYLIHRPLESRPDYIKHFQKKLQGVELVDKNPDEIPIVAAMTKVLDDCVGSLLEKVSELGIEDNTIVVFTSDNGAYKTSLTGPHRGRKGDTYEGGLKVPYIFKWPGKIKAGSSCDERIIGMDLYPTLLAMAGIDTPESYPLDGVDLTPLLVQDIGALPARQLYCFYPKYAGFSKNKQRWALSWRNVIYDGDYKLIEYPEYGEYELFNLEDDPLEEENLASKYPEKRQTLTATLHRWLKEIDAPELELNPDYSLN